MEIEKPKKEVVVFCSDEEKRKLWIEAVDDFFDGNNRLCQRIDRMVDIKIDPVDLELLLNRIMQEDTLSDIRTLMNGLLVSHEKYYANKLASYEEEMKEWGSRIAKKGETTDEKKMRLTAIKEESGKPNPIVEVYFNRFDFSLEYDKQWAEYYAKYSEFLLLGNQNMFHLKNALEKKTMLDVTFTIYKGEIIRFSTLKPFSKCKTGMQMPKPK